MKGKVNLDAISVVLVRPKFPENIGSVARAMKNMGLSRLIIVEGVSPLQMQAYKLASGAEEILERADEFSSLREAIDEHGMCGRHDLSAGQGEKSSADARILSQNPPPAFSEELDWSCLRFGKRWVDQ